MAYPTLNDAITFSVILVLGVALAYISSKALKFRFQTSEIADIRKEASLGLLVFIAVFVVTFGIYAFYDSVWVRTTLVADPIYVLRDGIWIVVILLPVIVALKSSKQNLGSIGIYRSNLSKNIALGFALSAAFIVIVGVLAPFLGGSFAGLSSPSIFALLSAMIVGFGEEIVFRGYIQTRLTAKNGVLLGLAATAVLFALFQFPVGYYCFRDIWLGLLYALWRLSTGLLFGYMFHKSQSIIPSAIFHGILVWWALQWALYF